MRPCAGMHEQHNLHYSDITWTSLCLKLLATPPFVQPFVQAYINANIKVPPHWTLWGEYTSDWWIPFTKGQWCGKCFHFKMSSCPRSYNMLLHTAQQRHMYNTYIILNSQRHSSYQWSIMTSSEKIDHVIIGFGYTMSPRYTSKWFILSWFYTEFEQKLLKAQSPPGMCITQRNGGVTSLGPTGHDSYGSQSAENGSHH